MVTDDRQVIAFKRYFLDFYESQIYNVQAKIEWTLQLIRTTQKVPEKYFKHMEKGMFEIRVEVGNNYLQNIFLLRQRKPGCIRKCISKKITKDT